MQPEISEKFISVGYGKYSKAVPARAGKTEKKKKIFRTQMVESPICGRLALSANPFYNYADMAYRHKISTSEPVRWDMMAAICSWLILIRTGGGAYRCERYSRNRTLFSS